MGILNRDTSITWLGHAAFKITSPGGKVVMIDPWLSGNPACPDHLKAVERCDLILVTHGHFDHLGDTVPLAQQTGATVIGIFELATYLQGKGVKSASGMNKGGTQVVDGIKVTMVHAIHSCGALEGENIVYTGEPAGYVVELENGFKVYHAGDTAVFSDMRLIGEIYRPDLALLPIGDYYVMSPKEAAHAVRLLGVRRIVPMHYQTFPVLTGTPEALRQEAADIEGLEIIEMRPGDTID
jgi:L-ascorbate metabolism protein UlaG (beta-lactamase superfamily)